MATRLWTRCIRPEAFLRTTAATGVSLARSSAGYPRASYPLNAVADIAAVVPLGILADYQPAAALKVRVRLYSWATAETYQLAAQFMARGAGDSGGAEAFNATATEFASSVLPSTAAELQDVTAEIPAGAARDNAADGDSLHLMLILRHDAMRTNELPLLIESVEVWQEIG